ncbi:hypothetical protein Tco_0507605 [Tanacetum coccineum]
MTTLAKHIIVAGAENCPPMLEKSMYDSWASRICLFIKGKKHGRMMLDFIDNGLLVYPIVEENRHTRPMKYSELTEAQQLQDDCDVQATNIILEGLPPDVYALVNHQELINGMHTIGMTMQLFMVYTKFLNALPSEWGKFVTDVKLAQSLYTTNYDQLYAYISQHERHANEVCITRESIKVFNIKQSNQNIVIPEIKQTITTLCTQPKRLRNVAWFKEKLMLAEAQEAGQILDEEQL